MIVFILAMVVAAIAVIALLVAIATKDGDTKANAGIVAVAGVVIAGLMVLFDSMTFVSARTVGVETQAGRPVAVLDNGFHMVAPWSSVDDSWDATIQTDQFSPTVRLANGTTAAVDVSVQFQIDTSGQFLTLWKQYRSFGNLKANVIERQTAKALNQVFETFNPLTAINADGNQTVEVSSFAPQVKTLVAGAMPAGITIANVTLPLIKYDATVQNQINSVIAAAAATRVAEQQEQTAKAQADANNTLAAAATTPGVIEQQCLSITQAALKAGEQLPQGWTCLGNSPSVVVPTK